MGADGDRWTRPHALAMLLASIAALWLGTPVPATAVGACSFAALLWLHRGRYTPRGGLGLANAVTLLRLLLVLLLGGGAAWVLRPAGALLVVLVFALDGLDGLIARRRGTASAFGARLDMETDALMVLVLALALVIGERLGPHILWVGALRYLYALVLPLLPARGREPPASRLGRYAFSCVVVSLAASLWPLPAHAPLSWIATGLLSYSFGRSVVWALWPV